MIVYRCEDSLEGILTAIYNAYEEKRNHQDTMVCVTEEPFLFAEDVIVQSDREKAEKVMRTLKRRFGEKDFECLCMAMVSEDVSKAQAVYQTVVEALGGGGGQDSMFDSMANDSVRIAYTLGRKTWNEYHHLMGFVRFEELEGKILYSKIGPKSNILTFLMPHFSDRLSPENFMIYDERRDMLGLHPAGKEWYLMQGTGDPKEAGGLCLSDSELGYQELFRFFCHKIMIEERRNPQLQRNLLPLRFREYMTEFQ